MKIDRDQWLRLSSQLDAALQIDASEREAWLAQLPGDAAALREPLRPLLAQRAADVLFTTVKSADDANAAVFNSAWTSAYTTSSRKLHDRIAHTNH